MPHGGRTAVKIKGFYSTARCCNQGRAVTPRCLSGFDDTPKIYIFIFVVFRLINVFGYRGQVDRYQNSDFGLHLGNIIASIASRCSALKDMWVKEINASCSTRGGRSSAMKK